MVLILVTACSIDRHGLHATPGDRRDSGTTDAGGVDAGAADAGPVDACGACECSTVADCPAPAAGPWTECGGFDGPCDDTGTQAQVVTEWRCEGARCIASDETVTRACGRDVEGSACGSPVMGEWSACEYADDCDENGQRTRTSTEMTCRAGTCTSATTTETDECSRDTDSDICVSGSCRGFCAFGRCNTECGGIIGCSARCAGCDVAECTVVGSAPCCQCSEC